MSPRPHDPLSARYFRIAWNVNQVTSKDTDGVEPLTGSVFRSVRESYPFPPTNLRIIKRGDSVFEYPDRPGRCIYCASPVYTPDCPRRLGDEHIIAEALNGTLVLKEASCQNCESNINPKEAQTLRGVMWAPRHHLNLRMKKRSREPGVICSFDVDGQETLVRLPIEDHPAMLLLPLFNPPGALSGRPDNVSGVHGIWHKSLNFNPGKLQAAGRKRGYSAPVDTLRFSQMLAKIAHSFSVAELGLSRFQPTLNAFILRNHARDEADLSGYRFIGGVSTLEPPNENLHEIGWAPIGVEYMLYVLVRIRLFALLGAPTFYVIPGYVTDSSLFTQLTRRLDT